jgi:AAA+ superfamily predicted ATPase
LILSFLGDFMAHFYVVIFSLFFIGNTLLSEIVSDRIETDGKKIFTLQSRNIPEIQEEKIDPNSEQQDDLSKEGIAELELVFEHSPEEAQVIVKHLQDPHYFPHNKDYRSAYFVGEPGSGKTMMARAIAYKMSKEGWDHKFIDSTELLGEYRNQTAIRLKNELKVVIASKRPTVVVIDELHRLLENAESKHHDTDTAATALWLFLDKQSSNENFFLIGTMNRVTKIPRPFKDRIVIDIIKFPNINDAQVKNSLFRQIITSHKMSFENDVTDEFLNAELKKLGFCRGRTLRNLSKLLFKIQRMDSDESILPTVIKKEIITRSVAHYVELQNDMDYDFVEETDEERQNRYHIENINLQKQHHKENQRLQEQHFVQQQVVQLVSSQYKLDPIAIFGAGLHVEHVRNCMSDEQLEIFYKIEQEAVTRNKNEGKQ